MSQVIAFIRIYCQRVVYVNMFSCGGIRWDDPGEYVAEFDHPLWRRLEEQSRGAGHGGMDFIEDYRLVESLRKGRVPDMDVYDAAMMSAVIELSGRSIARGSEPLPFPDFTRGAWRRQRPLIL